MDRKILITNDDGIDADGLIRLVECAKEFGEVWVVAPDSQRSAMSHSLTLRHSVDVWEVDFPVEGVHAYACDGTPVDCVRIGIHNIVPGGPDNVFSGINLGFNMASDLQYSATVGAAFEAVFNGVHAIAFSEGFDDEHLPTKKYIKEIMAELIDKSLGVNQIWNVNFPQCSLEECGGILRDRLVSTDAFYNDRYNVVATNGKRVTYMVEGIRNYEASENTDLKAILDNYISIGIATNIS